LSQAVVRVARFDSAPAAVKRITDGRRTAAVLDRLPVSGRGKKAKVFLVRNEKELTHTLRELVRFGRPIRPYSQKFSRCYELPDGTTVGFRLSSKSSGKTIDINLPGQNQKWKVHIR